MPLETMQGPTHKEMADSLNPALSSSYLTVLIKVSFSSAMPITAPSCAQDRPVQICQWQKFRQMLQTAVGSKHGQSLLHHESNREAG